MELLLGSYSADLGAIDTEIKIFIDKIQDTDQYISAHLDSVRNEIIKMSLFIEVGGLIMAFGAVMGGIFGMNLKNHIEVNQLKIILSFSPSKNTQESPWAFTIVCISMVVAMIIIALVFTLK